MRQNIPGATRVAMVAGAAALTVGAMPLAALAAEPEGQSAADLAPVEAVTSQNLVSNQVRPSSVVGSFTFDQTTVTPNSAIKKAFLGTDVYLCGAQGGTSLASQPLDEWNLSVGGDVESAFTATLDELADDSALTVQMGCSCAANGADQRVVANAEVTGIRFADIVRQAGVRDDANTVTFTTSDGYEVSLPLAYVTQRYSLIVFEVGGEPLENSMGGTNQLWLGSTSAKYFARDVVAIDFSHQDTPPAAPGAQDSYANSPNVGVLSSEA